jgi:hypothetical protein
MKDTDEKILGKYLSGDPPDKAFKKQTLRDSIAAFNRVRRLRAAWRCVKLAAAAVLVVGVAFLGGRLSMPPTSHTPVDVPANTDTDDGVNVPSELVAWLEAARLFSQLGMEDRMARAVERANRLLPADTFSADGRTLRVSAAGYIENQTERVEPMGISGPHSSAETINQILAQAFGD